MGKSETIYLIGNAHIDPVWLWQWTEGREEVFSTCRTAIELLEEDPEFVFCRSSAATYSWIEEHEPVLFEQIRQRITEGRWVIVGGWWEQPDCNVPSGESLVRQGLYGKRYFLTRFGVEVTVGYNVDTFGHPATLPRILAGCGMNAYCFFRPQAHEKELPGGVFRWVAPGGAEVIACRPEGIYATGPEDIEGRIREAAGSIQTPLTSTLAFYGVGNHGGGPTRRNIASIHRLQSDPELPTLKMAGPEPFFREAHANRDALPIVEDELQYHARGCYTAVSEVKREIRRSEQLLEAAERYCAVACGLGLGVLPTEEFAEAWHRVLFNQFHDILAGTSIRPAYDDTRADLEEAQAIARRRLRESLHRIAARVDTSGEGQPLVVFNPTASPRREVVSVDLACCSSGEAITLVDDQGNEVAATYGVPSIHTRSSTYPISFLADLPPLGYRAYRAVRQAPTASLPSVEASPTHLESARFRVEVDPQAGTVTRILDKESGKSLLAGPANALLVIRDDSDTWSHDVVSFREEVGRFTLTGDPEAVAAGPTHAALRLRFAYGASTIEQQIVLYQDAPRIDFRTTIDWHESHRMLKVAFPTALEDAEATFEVAYGHITREANGGEEPVHRWMDLTGRLEGGVYGLALLNDSKYGCDVRGGEMRLSLLRSPIFAFHDPQKPKPDERYEYTDQGVQQVTYSLLPHAGDWRDAQVVQHAAALNAPVCSIPEAPHRGPWPGSRSFLSATGDQLVLEVLKGAEDGDGLVLRGYESTGRPCTSRISFLGTDLGEVCLGAHEIKTWRLLCDSGYWTLCECEMLERFSPCACCGCAAE